jgi:hypothetical protein
MPEEWSTVLTPPGRRAELGESGEIVGVACGLLNNNWLRYTLSPRFTEQLSLKVVCLGVVFGRGTPLFFLKIAKPLLSPAASDI